MTDQGNELLIIGYVWPEPDSSAAGRRMMDLISAFQSAGWNITFATSALESEHRTDLESRDIATKSIKVNDSSFNDFVAGLQPDAVLFDRFIIEEQFGWRVEAECPSAVRILDTEDLHFLRRARRAALNKDRPLQNDDLLESETAKREIASIYRSDLSLLISEYELHLLTDLFDINQSLLCYFPFSMAEIGSESRKEWPSYEERSHFMTIGNFLHPPNWDAVRYLRNTIWPLIYDKLPKAELHIYGAYVTQKAEQLHAPNENFYVDGRAPSSQEVMRQSRICLAPLRFGAGLKGKLTEAMQCGTPSVATNIGAEGLQGDLPWGGAVWDDPRKFAASAVELYSDKRKWKEAQRQGTEIVNNRFAGQGFASGFLNRVEMIKENLEEYRRNNFIGAMLQHHTAASSKYMSRWIEEKNRNEVQSD